MSAKWISLFARGSQVDAAFVRPYLSKIFGSALPSSSRPRRPRAAPSQTSNLVAGSPYQSKKNTSFLHSCRLLGDGFSSPGSKREGRKHFYYFAAARLELWSAHSVSLKKLWPYFAHDRPHKAGRQAAGGHGVREAESEGELPQALNASKPTCTLNELAKRVELRYQGCGDARQRSSKRVTREATLSLKISHIR